MPNVHAIKILSRRDLDFLLFEWLDVESLTARPRFADHSRETFDAALDTAEQIATDLFAPHNKKSDSNEPHFDGDDVTIIPEVKTALDAFAAAGLMAAGQDYELDGMQLPCVVEKAAGGLVHRGQRRHLGLHLPDHRQRQHLAQDARTPRQVEQFVRADVRRRDSSAPCACPNRRPAPACPTSPPAPSPIRSTAPKASASTG